MNLAESFLILRRQWILSCALLLLTLIGTAAAAIKLPWTYQSVGTVVLINSKSASAADDGNPLLAFSSSLASTAEVLGVALTSPTTARSLQAQGYTAPYQVALSSVTGGPLLQITVTGSNSAVVENTLHGVMNDASTQLLDLQPGVARDNRIRALPLSAQQEPKHSLSKKAKPLVAVLAIGLVVTFAGPQIADGLAGRRRRKGAAPPQKVRYQADANDSGQNGRRYPDGAVPSGPGVRGEPRATRPSPDPGREPISRAR